MATKIGINGFGRIGRLVFRSLVEKVTTITTTHLLATTATASAGITLTPPNGRSGPPLNSDLQTTFVRSTP